jgi:hypothetical protein
MSKPSIRAQQLIDWIVQHLGKQELTGIEIGVNRGATSRDLLQRFPKLHLLMVDPWKVPEPGSSYATSGDRMSQQPQEWHDQARNEAMEATEFAADRRSVFEKRWEEAAAWVESKSLDFAFIDGDHSYAGVSQDIKLVWERLVDGGLMMGHDYNREGVSRAVGTHAVNNGVLVVVKDGVAQNDGGPLEIHTGEHATWMIIKPHDEPGPDRSLWRKSE